MAVAPIHVQQLEIAAQQIKSPSSDRMSMLDGYLGGYEVSM
ncbi:MAG: hypothetical protein ACFB4I_19360 [Cyanophyceae cyanobacterium]